MKINFNEVIEKYIKETTRDYLVGEEQLETFLYTALKSLMADTNCRLSDITFHLEVSTNKFQKELKRLRKKLQ